MKKLTYITAFAAIVFSACKDIPETRPQRKNIIDAVFASGVTTTINEYKITAFQDGYLKSSLVTEGDSVKAGQLLFKLDDAIQQSQTENALVNYEYAKNNANSYAPQIAQLQEQINQAVRKKQTDVANLQRYENLIKTNAVSKADYDNIKLIYDNDVSAIAQLQKQLANLKQSLEQGVVISKIAYKVQQQNNHYYNLSSAGSGIVLNIYKHNGDLIKKGETVASIGSGAQIAKLYIDEDDIRKVQLNQQVMIALNTDKNTLYPAVITKIYPSFNEGSQSFIAEASFIKIPAGLKDSTQLQANIIISEKKNALVIPGVYIWDSDSVQVKGEKGLRVVKTGITTMEWTEITGGLSENDILQLPKKQ
ncbi:efflux RND transporter periplasmic adaptor subunit [Parafilimonas sp.]|uniref:efflux RND transporter periplasmic adaptor subunit n=1 Tax=Parafilimonas sp. TaxID=1969739 RepID=UPI003F8212FA